jgi:hypothetical protein
MKNRKWLTYTLGTLLTLIALAVVGLAGFRVGMMQVGAFPHMGIGERPMFNQNVDKNDPNLQGANPNGNGSDDSGPRGYGFNPRGFDRGHRGMPMLGGLFGLIHVAILALLLWFGYKLVQNSGWRFVRVSNDAPAASPSVNAEVEEKKESE